MDPRYAITNQGCLHLPGECYSRSLFYCGKSISVCLPNSIIGSQSPHMFSYFDRFAFIYRLLPQEPSCNQIQSMLERQFLHFMIHKMMFEISMMPPIVPDSIEHIFACYENAVQAVHRKNRTVVTQHIYEFPTQ